MSARNITRYIGNVEVYYDYARSLEVVGPDGPQVLKIAPVVSDDAWELVWLEFGGTHLPIAEVFPDGSIFPIGKEYTQEVQLLVRETGN